MGKNTSFEPFSIASKVFHQYPHIPLCILTAQSGI